jgi:hypothetical protein
MTLLLVAIALTAGLFGAFGVYRAWRGGETADP